jgi:CubicO group peptidase (beta-lactamase class C family)
MKPRAWNPDRLRRLDAVLAGHVERGDVVGLTWLLARGGDVHAGAAGTLRAGVADGGGDATGTPSGAVGRDTIYRISSTTKPIVAVAALTLVEQCVLRLDDPVDDLLPELADRRVLADPEGPLDDTVPASRPITVGDLLTFRSGLGWDFATSGPQPVMAALFERGLGGGPPMPQQAPGPDDWIRVVGSVPLAHQPGTRWLYHTSAEMLGVLIARAAGQPLDVVVTERVLGPLGMDDTAFFVPDAQRHRLGAVFGADPETGERTVYDPPDGQWATPPAFPGGGDGLVSTVDDLAAFGRMLLAGGEHRGERLLSRPTVEAMTTNHLSPTQLAGGGPDPDGRQGWGLGVGIHLQRHGTALSPGSYGWDGGLGTVWANDPAEDLVGVLLTNQMWTSPVLPPVARDFWTATYAAFAD